jgi:hypothetical protein
MLLFRAAHQRRPVFASDLKNAYQSAYYRDTGNDEQQPSTSRYLS